MGNLQLGRVNDFAVEQENIDVDQARTARRRTRAYTAEICFDGVNAHQESLRSKSGITFSYLIQEPGLIGDVLRLGLVKGRGLDDLDLRRREHPQRGRKVFLSISQIGSQRKINRSGQKTESGEQRRLPG